MPHRIAPPLVSAPEKGEHLRHPVEDFRQGQALADRGVYGEGDEGYVRVGRFVVPFVLFRGKEVNFLITLAARSSAFRRLSFWYLQKLYFQKFKRILLKFLEIVV